MGPRNSLTDGLQTPREGTLVAVMFPHIGNESVPKIVTNNTINLFFKLQSAFWQFQTITGSEYCMIKLLPYVLFEKLIYILALEMASPGNQHCANSIGTLSFPVADWKVRGEVRCRMRTNACSISITKVHAAMRPMVTITVATCLYACVLFSSAFQFVDQSKLPRVSCVPASGAHDASRGIDVYEHYSDDEVRIYA